MASVPPLQADSLTPAKGPRTLAGALDDFYRLHDPPRRWSALEAATRYGHDEPALFAFLEDKYAAPGFFRAQHVHFASAFFDPARALYEPHLVPPVPEARPLDCVHKAQILLPAGARDGGHAVHVHVGVLHAESRSASDASWWRGDVPGTLLDWLVDALPPTGPLSGLRALVKAKAAVVVSTRHVRGDGSVSAVVWRGWLKGADAEGNLLLVGATREGEGEGGGGGGRSDPARGAEDGVREEEEEEEEEGAPGTAADGAGVGAPRVQPPHPLPHSGAVQVSHAGQVILAGHAVISVARSTGRVRPPPRDVEAHLRR